MTDLNKLAVSTAIAEDKNADSIHEIADLLAEATMHNPDVDIDELVSRLHNIADVKTSNAKQFAKEVEEAKKAEASEV